MARGRFTSLLQNICPATLVARFLQLGSACKRNIYYAKSNRNRVSGSGDSPIGVGLQCPSIVRVPGARDVHRLTERQVDVHAHRRSGALNRWSVSGFPTRKVETPLCRSWSPDRVPDHKDLIYWACDWRNSSRSSNVFGQSFFSRSERERSARSLPPVWQRGQ
jgi:hypothetical protein